MMRKPTEGTHTYLSSSSPEDANRPRIAPRSPSTSSQKRGASNTKQSFDDADEIETLHLPPETPLEPPSHQPLADVLVQPNDEEIAPSPRNTKEYLKELLVDFRKHTGAVKFQALHAGLKSLLVSTSAGFGITALVAPCIVYFAIPYQVTDQTMTFDRLSPSDKWKYIIVYSYSISTTAILVTTLFTYFDPRQMAHYNPATDEEHARRVVSYYVGSCAIYMIGWAIFSTTYFFRLQSIAQVNVVIFLCAFATKFLILHYALRGQPGHHGKQVAACCLSTLLEFGFGFVTSRVTALIHSDVMQWIAPFIFFFTSLIIRRAAENVVAMPSLMAARFCTVGISLTSYFSRISQVKELTNYQQIIILELFYAVVSLTARVTLYWRYGLLSLWMSGKCTLKREQSERRKVISARAVTNDIVMDTACFISVWICRYVTERERVDKDESIVLSLVFVGIFCVFIQFCCGVATCLVVSFFEGIPVLSLSPNVSALSSFLKEVYYYWLFLCFAFMQMLDVVIQLWIPSARLRW
eukprot:PhF_6_TR31362/c0_g1_i1/m.45901